MSKLAEAVVCLSISSFTKVSRTGLKFRAEPRNSAGEIILTVEKPSGFATLTFGIDGKLLPEIRAHVQADTINDLKQLPKGKVCFGTHGPELIEQADLDLRRPHRIFKY